MNPPSIKYYGQGSFEHPQGTQELLGKIKKSQKSSLTSKEKVSKVVFWGEDRRASKISLAPGQPSVAPVQVWVALEYNRYFQDISICGAIQEQALGL